MWGYKDLLAARIAQGEVKKEGVEKGEFMQCVRVLSLALCN